MTDDRALLEAAARAAGIVVERSRLDDPACRDILVKDSARNPHQKYGPWNPLTDDGDALRLALKLRLNITFTRALGPSYREEFMQVAPATMGHLAEFGPIGDDPGATLRLFIVRAAAALAKAD